MSEKLINSTDLRGVWTALVTPFSEDGALNLPSFKRLVDRMSEAGLTGIVPLGSTGESAALTADERVEVIRAAVETANGKLMVMVGCGTNNTRTTEEYVMQAADMGADAALLVAPYYNKPTPEGLRRHFLQVADASPIPLVLYHIPGRSVIGIPPDLTLELAKHERIIGIKEAGGDLWRSSELIRNAPDNFAILSGDDPLTLPLMSVGASGVVAVMSNIAPKLVKRMLDACLSSDFSTALAIHQQLSPLYEATAVETNPAPAKAILNLQGFEAGPPRLPLVSIKEESLAKIKALLPNLETLA